MDLSTSYLGLKLGSPLIVGASPFADDTHVARQIEDSGAGAIVMRSLFEEQIYLDELTRAPRAAVQPKAENSGPGAFPAPAEYRMDPEAYLRRISDLKAALAIPVIASLNGCRPGGWIDFGRRFEDAGADAIELNLYHFSSDPGSSALEVEAELIETVRRLKASVGIPVAVKLQSEYTALANFSRELERAGADGIVVFNRLYQSDYDIDEARPLTELQLSSPSELLLRLRWLALLAPNTRCSLAITGGVHTARDAIKAIMAGAHAVQLVSVLLKNGPRYLSTVAEGLRQWMERNRYKGLEDFRGRLIPNDSADPEAARGDNQRMLQKWRA